MNEQVLKASKTVEVGSSRTNFNVGVAGRGTDVSIQRSARED